MPVIADTGAKIYDKNIVKNPDAKSLSMKKDKQNRQQPSGVRCVLAQLVNWSHFRISEAVCVSTTSVL